MYLSKINTYPIKSTHPISIEAGYLFSSGIGFDRHWMLIDAENNMLTSRKYPRLLHLISHIEGSSLRVVLPQQDFLLPLVPKPSAPVMVKHWGESLLPAWPQNSALDKALSDYLGISCQLVYSANLRSDAPIETASFADAQPLLLTTTASLEALNKRLDAATDETTDGTADKRIGMDRFRTNLVVNNHTPDIEDNWKKIRIGACELEVSYPCERCVLTTIDPVSLVQHKQQEPLRTLAQYRRLETGGVGFGINLTVCLAGPIAVGDTVEILE
ncbi:MAG: MOSC domain-containing protein [Oceanospirillaceae bacterium]|jgi:hypothetical protein